MFKVTFDFGSGGIELELSDAMVCHENKVSLFCEPCGRKFYVCMSDTVKGDIQLASQI